MPAHVKEEKFESDIVEWLTTEGGYTVGTESHYDRKLGIDTAELFAFIGDTQDQAVEPAALPSRDGPRQGSAGNSSPACPPRLTSVALSMSFAGASRNKGHKFARALQARLRLEPDFGRALREEPPDRHPPASTTRRRTTTASTSACS